MCSTNLPPCTSLSSFMPKILVEGAYFTHLGCQQWHFFGLLWFIRVLILSNFGLRRSLGFYLFSQAVNCQALLRGCRFNMDDYCFILDLRCLSQSRCFFFCYEYFLVLLQFYVSSFLLTIKKLAHTFLIITKVIDLFSCKKMPYNHVDSKHGMAYNQKIKINQQGVVHFYF